MLLLDVTPLSLGIETLGGVVAKIIHRNSTIPASATEHFTTGVDGQTNVAIHVLQGERELAKDCRSLARFDLKGIPPMPAGLPRIEVQFLIDANGILHVSARELRSGKEAEIEVQPSYGLTDEQVENMILESFDNAEEDFRQRQVIEARNEAETMLTALEKGRKNPAWEQLSPQERTDIDKLEAALRAVMQEDDYQAIRSAIDVLNQGTMRLAELMMDSAVGAALKGKNMDDCRCGRRAGGAASHRAGGDSSRVVEPGILCRRKNTRRRNGDGGGPGAKHGPAHLPSREQDVRVRARQAALPGTRQAGVDSRCGDELRPAPGARLRRQLRLHHLSRGGEEGQGAAQRDGRRRGRPSRHGCRPAAELAPGMPGRDREARRSRGRDSGVEPQLRF